LQLENVCQKGQADPVNQRPDRWSSTVLWFPLSVLNIASTLHTVNICTFSASCSSCNVLSAIPFQHRRISISSCTCKRPIFQSDALYCRCIPRWWAKNFRNM